MTWVPGRGRPVVIPEDATPLRGARIDARGRIAWLLRLSRLAAAPGPAGRFVEMLRAQGCELGPSTLCRYETGVEAIPKQVVRAYEKALGAPAGSLLGACLGIDRAFGPALAADGPQSVSRTALSDALGDWETMMAAGSMAGTDWIHLADAITRPTGPLLPPSMLHGWIQQLVGETMRAVRHGYTTRVHALNCLLSDASTGRIVLDSIADAVAQPGAQSVSKVLPVLGNSRDPEVLRWLIDHFDNSTGEQMWGAAYGMLSQICNGRMPGQLVPTVAQAVLNAAADGPGRGEPAFHVAQRISADLTRQVVARLGFYPAPTAAGARVQSPTALSNYRAAGLRVSGLDDPMLDRLLREALSPDFLERQHHSSTLLGVSPYRRTIVEVAIEQVRQPAGPYARDAAAHLLGYLAVPEEQDLLVDLLETVPEARGAMLVALARIGGVPGDIDLAAMATDPMLGATVVEVAGMSRHPDLDLLASSPQVAGEQVQRNAIWWQQMGGAITDVPAGMPSDCLSLAG